MADTKVTGLAAITPILTDVLYIIDDPGGTPLSKKVTLTAVQTLLLTALDAGDSTYTPAVATDWDSDADPGDVDDALDQLAERTDDLELVVEDASDVTYTPGTATDWNGDADPGDVVDALDQLAERIDDVEEATEEIFLGAAAGWPSTTNGCAALAQVEYGTNDVDLQHLDFDKTADEFAQWTHWMADNWNAGTVTATFAWTAAGGTPAETVAWTVQGRAYANDDAIDQAWGAPVTISDTLIATGDIHISSATAAVTLAGTPAAGQPVQFRVFRDVSEDDLDDDARLIGVKVHYTRVQ